MIRVLAACLLITAGALAVGCNSTAEAPAAQAPTGGWTSTSITGAPRPPSGVVQAAPWPGTPSFAPDTGLPPRPPPPAAVPGWSDAPAPAPAPAAGASCGGSGKG